MARWLGLRRLRPWAWLVLVLALVLLSVADHRGWLLYDAGDLRVYDGRTFQVTHVVDGDTLTVAQPDGQATSAQTTTRVRLWGIDAPELVGSNETPTAEPFAEAARSLARSRCEGQPVILQLEPHRLRDSYGRLLAYVILPDGTSLNEILLVEGLAKADARWNHRHEHRYAMLERQSRRDRRGMWGQALDRGEDPPKPAQAITR